MPMKKISLRYVDRAVGDIAAISTTVRVIDRIEAPMVICLFFVEILRMRFTSEALVNQP